MGEVRTLNHISGAGAWDLYSREPAPALRRWVLTYHDYIEHVRYPRPRIEKAAPLVPVIINLGPPFRLSGSTHGSFTAGLYDEPVISESTGPSRCIQLNFTPLGASRLLGMPLGLLARQVVPLDAIWGRVAGELAERLEETPSPEQRFDLLDTTLLALIANSPAPGREILWVWDELEASGGMRSIGSLGSELGWSRKRMIGCFREHLGIPPKIVARMIRFERVATLLQRDPETSWSQAAYRCGYFDQAHLIRDCRQFTGVTPEVWKGQF